MSALPQKKDNQVVIRFEEWMLRDLTSLVLRAYEESRSMQALAFSERRVHEMLAFPIFRPTIACGLACVDMDTREIPGAIIATIGATYYSEEPIASEVLAYVLPDHRNGSVGASLLEAYEKWARRVGVKRMTVSGIEAPGEWEKVGTQFSKELA